ncbi:hypothetical protein Tco_0445195 [Tanacetum coccineum]
MMLMIQLQAMQTAFDSISNAFTKAYSTPTNQKPKDLNKTQVNKKISQLRMNINQGRNRNQIVGNLQGNVAAPVVGITEMGIKLIK